MEAYRALYNCRYAGSFRTNTEAFATVYGMALSPSEWGRLKERLRTSSSNDAFTELAIQEYELQYIEWRRKIRGDTGSTPVAVPVALATVAQNSADAVQRYALGERPDSFATWVLW